MDVQLIISAVIYFVVYIGSHIAIGKWMKKCEKDASISNNQEVIKKAIRSKMIFKWYPAMYIVFTILTFSRW